MKKILISVVSAVLLLGCAEVMRYSPDEIKDFPPSIQENIKKGEVAPGMTMQQVRYSWGAPSIINVLKPTDEGKSKEEWVYTRSIFFRSKLIFIDGKLTHIITNEVGVVK